LVWLVYSTRKFGQHLRQREAYSRYDEVSWVTYTAKSPQDIHKTEHTTLSTVIYGKNTIAKQEGTARCQDCDFKQLSKSGSFPIIYMVFTHHFDIWSKTHPTIKT